MLAVHQALDHDGYGTLPPMRRAERGRRPPVRRLWRRLGRVGRSKSGCRRRRRSFRGLAAGPCAAGAGDTGRLASRDGGGGRDIADFRGWRVGDLCRAPVDAPGAPRLRTNRAPCACPPAARVRRRCALSAPAPAGTRRGRRRGATAAGVRATRRPSGCGNVPRGSVAASCAAKGAAVRTPTGARRSRQHTPATAGAHRRPARAIAGGPVRRPVAAGPRGLQRARAPAFLPGSLERPSRLRGREAAESGQLTAGTGSLLHAVRCAARGVAIRQNADSGIASTPGAPSIAADLSASAWLRMWSA